MKIPKINIENKLKNKGLKDGNKNIIAAIIFAPGMIIASLIYAFSTIYELTNNNPGIIDKWKGTIEHVKPID